MEPRYIADYGVKKWHVMDRSKPVSTGFIMNIPFDEFANLDWMKETGSLIMESSHGARSSKFSKAQPFETEEKAREFYAKCEERGVELRFSPEKSMFKWRATYFPVEQYKKSDEIDLKIWDEAITNHPFIWDLALRVKTVEFIESDEDSNTWIDSNILTKYKVGRIYNNELNDAFRLQSASQITYKKILPGQRAFESGCIDLVAERLGNHNSDDGKIKDGVAHTRINEHDIDFSLRDVLGYVRNAKGTGWNQPKKATQYVSCMMLLINLDGELYINSLTKKPMGYKDMKQNGMCSTPFHQKPGFPRPKWYHHGIKTIFKTKLKEYFGVEKMDYTIPEHHELKNFIRNNCRIAYEQTVKAMKQYLNTPKGLEKFL